MGYAGERMAEAARDALNNLGGALLRNLQTNKEEDRFQQQQGLAERGVDLQAQQLAQAKAQAAAQLAQNYTLHGFQQAPSGPDASAITPPPDNPDSQLLHPDVMRGASFGMGGVPAPNIGSALLSAVSSAPKAPPSTSGVADLPAPLHGSPGLPARPLATDPSSWTFAGLSAYPEGAATLAEIAARAAEASANRQTQIQVAKIGDAGATARNAANIDVEREVNGLKMNEPTAQAAAVNAIQHWKGDARAAYQWVLMRPDSPFKQQVLNAIASVEAQAGKRAMLGIGDSPRAQAAAATLMLQNGNDPQKALQAIAADPDTPAKQEIVGVLQGLYFDKQKRGALGIGQTDPELRAMLDEMKRQDGRQ